MSLRDSEYDTYFEKMRDCLEFSAGPYRNIVAKLPDFLDLFVELLRDLENVEEKERKLINAAIAYILAPYDVKPEKKTKKKNLLLVRRTPIWYKVNVTKVRNTEGYIDDVFLCSEVLMRLRGTLDEETIKSRWEGDEDIIELTCQINEELGESLDAETRKAILRYAGI